MVTDKTSRQKKITNDTDNLNTSIMKCIPIEIYIYIYNTTQYSSKVDTLFNCTWNIHKNKPYAG